MRVTSIVESKDKIVTRVDESRIDSFDRGYDDDNTTHKHSVAPMSYLSETAYESAGSTT